MIKLSTDDEEKRFEAMDALLELMGNNFGPETVPSVLGAERGRLIARITGCGTRTRKERSERTS